MLDNLFRALLLIFGDQADDNCQYIIDPIEWSDPRYFHQN